jgi:hypothetical protein
MEILSPEEMAARQGAPDPATATPQDSKPRTVPGSFMKRFAVPVVIAGALGLAVTAFMLIPRSDPSPAPAASESAEVSAPALMPKTQEACGYILQAEEGNPALYNYFGTIVRIRTYVELNPTLFEAEFRSLLQKMQFGINSYDQMPELAQATGAELHDYCSA